MLREAMGSSKPAPGDRVRERELPAIRLMQAQVADGVRPARGRALAARLRRLRAAYRRDRAKRLVALEVEQPLLDSGMTTNEMFRAAEEGAAQKDRPVHGRRPSRPVPRPPGGRLDEERSGRRRGRTRGRRCPQPAARAPAICFLDITGYTQLTEDRGDEAGAELAETVGGIVRRVSTRFGGKPTKWLGDGVMLYYPEAGAGGRCCATRSARAWGGRGFRRCTSGLHAGTVLFQEGGYSAEPWTWRPGSPTTRGLARLSWSARRWASTLRDRSPCPHRSGR